MAFSNNKSSGAMAEMNVTPLVDVMLVLLIIFMVTAPISSYPIDVNLPQDSTAQKPPTDPPEPIKVKIDATGQIMWDGVPTQLNQLPQIMKPIGAKIVAEQPIIEIDVSPDAQYDTLAKLLAETKNAGLEKVGFAQPVAAAP